MPLPGIGWHGTKDVFVDLSAKNIIPVFPGNIHTLFLTIRGIDICCMYKCFEA